MNGVEIPVDGIRPLKGKVLRCPPHAPFLASLAAALRDGAIWAPGKPEPHALAETVVYLPTHASVEPLKLALLASAPQGATFLPRIRVLGDPDPLDLFAIYGTRMASAAGATALFEEALAVPQAFGDLEREVELAALLKQAAQQLIGGAEGIDTLFLQIAPASALKMAKQIAALIGEAHAEGTDLTKAAMLSGGASTGAAQLSLQLFRAVIAGWLARKQKSGLLDREERRNRLMAIEADFIRQSDTPVIIAGSTGSIAATAKLMEAALSRPRSALAVYGLDTLPEEVWNTLGAHPEHPQHGLHDLLSRLGLRPPDIGLLQHDRSELGAAKRGRVLSEAMLPAPATAGWTKSLETLKREEAASSFGLSLIEAETLHDEASVIALILRQSLETVGQIAALVTPSDALLSRVRHALARWGSIPAPGSEDEDLAPRAAFCAATAKPEDFIALMRSCGGRTSFATRRAAEIADLGVLRQMWRPLSYGEIPAALARAQHAISSGKARHPALKRIAATEWEAARALTVKMIEALQPLKGLAGKLRPLSTWAAAHRETLANLERIEKGSSDAWYHRGPAVPQARHLEGRVKPGDDGGAPAEGSPSAGRENSILTSLEMSAPKSFMLDLWDYARLFAEASSRQASSCGDPHPRLRLWKPLDARLMTADVLILGGLNEGCWPQAPGPDPWLSRANRAFLGLPPQERRIGQAAHDFATLAVSAPRVYLTRAKKVDGTAARPSRWVSRIKALAGGIGGAIILEPQEPWQAWASQLSAPQKVVPAVRPEPRPPLAARPRKLSVTAIETWFANPYALYARQILGLEPLRGSHETGDARDKGILYHAALHGFFQDYPAELPKNTAAKLLQRLDRAAEELGFNLENAPFWRPRFARFAEWFEGTEAARRAGVEDIKSEAGGKLLLDAPGGPFEIRARADRIDRLAGGVLRIYDFKTSANTAKGAAGRGAPQLALEGLLAKEGAFAGIPPSAAVELRYIVASGGEPPGEIVDLRIPSAEAIEAARIGTRLLIERFDDEATPYAYETRAIFRDKAENDPYAHLARVSEWAGIDRGDADDE